jgi:hypothetical protein
VTLRPFSFHTILSSPPVLPLLSFSFRSSFYSLHSFIFSALLEPILFHF